MPYKDKQKLADWKARNKDKTAIHQKRYKTGHKELREELRYSGAVNQRTENARYWSGEKTRPFIGVDGEGGTRDGIHNYYLLRMGDDYLYKKGRPLDWLECIEFLFRTGMKSGAIPVAYFFNYDVTMIFKSAPLELQRQLYDRDSRRYLDEHKREKVRLVNMGGYGVDFLPGKFLIIGGEWNGKFKQVEISDLKGFFQCSFVKALQTWKIGDADTVAKIAADKARRSEFTGVYSAEDIEYNRLEVELLEKLADKLRSACINAETVPTRWQGAGCLASAMLKKNGAEKRTVEQLPERIKTAAQFAYFGGRFEARVIGQIDGPIYEADISSAYPAAMLELPPMGAGAGFWDSHKRKVEKIKHPYFIALIGWTVENPERTKWGPFLWRSSTGRIFAPASGTAWVYGFEIQEALKHPGITIKTYQVHEYKVISEEKPFNWVPEKFAQRVSLGAQAEGIVLKLGINSLYGKTCQSVGAATYANPVYAGMITSWTRAKLYSTLRYHDPESVLMMATDAVFLREKPRFEVAQFKSLGTWDETQFSDLFIVQPGVYYCGGESQAHKVKSRGLPQAIAKAKLNQFRNAWYKNGFDGRVKIDIESCFIGAREALHRNRPELIGQWTRETRDIVFMPVKRRPGEYVNGEGRTQMLDVGGAFSTEYKKIIGGVPLQDAGFIDPDMPFPEHPDGSETLLDQAFSED